MKNPILIVTITERAAFIAAFVILALLMWPRRPRPDNVKAERKPDAELSIDRSPKEITEQSQRFAKTGTDG